MHSNFFGVNAIDGPSGLPRFRFNSDPFFFDRFGLGLIVGNLPDDNYARSELAPIMGPVPIGHIFYSFLWPIEWK